MQMSKNANRKRKKQRRCGVIVVEDEAMPSPAPLPSPMTDQIERFIAWLQVRKYSPKTQQARRLALCQLARFLVDNGIDQFQDLSVELFDRYHSYLRERQLKPYTIENYLTAVRMLYDWQEEQGAIFENPTRFSEIRKHQPALPQVLSVPQMRRLLAAPDVTTPAGLRDRAMLETLYSTGMRREELQRLDLFDVDLKTKLVIVTGKGNKQRTVPLGREAARIVERYLKQGRPQLIIPERYATDALWINRMGRRQSGQMIGIMFRTYSVKAGLKERATAHTLRRSCATHMLKNGAHPVIVAELLGHAGLNTLRHYLRVTIDQLKAMHRRSKPGR